ncbi:MAG: hypothetical protein ACOYLR_10135 [Chlorobium sp.]
MKWTPTGRQFDVITWPGGRGKMWQLFGKRMGAIIDELNEVLTA